MKTCSVEGCSGEHRARGMCVKHYERVRMHGSLGVLLYRTPKSRIGEVYNGCTLLSLSGRKTKYCNAYGIFRCGCGKEFETTIDSVVRGKTRSCGCRTTRVPRTQAEREEVFWARVDKNGPDGCWLWTGSTNLRGYGLAHEYREGRKRTVQAHIAAYELVNGPIPRVPSKKRGLIRLSLDHECRNRRCVNPAHLQVCTVSRNTKLAHADRNHDGLLRLVEDLRAENAGLRREIEKYAEIGY